MSASIVISDWKRIQRGALQGTFTAELASGLRIRKCALFEKEGHRTVAGPSETFKMGDKVTYKGLIEFRDKATKDRFSQAILAVLDIHLKGGR